LLNLYLNYLAFTIYWYVDIHRYVLSSNCHNMSFLFVGYFNSNDDYEHPYTYSLKFVFYSYINLFISYIFRRTV